MDKSHPGQLPLLSSRLWYCEFARFQTVSNRASSKRLHYVCLFTHPSLLICGSDPQKGSACAEAWKHWKEMYGYTYPNYSTTKLRFYFRIKEWNRKKMFKLSEKCVKLLIKHIIQEVFCAKEVVMNSVLMRSSHQSHRCIQINTTATTTSKPITLLPNIHKNRIELWPSLLPTCGHAPSFPRKVGIMLPTSFGSGNRQAWCLSVGKLTDVSSSKV